MNVVDSSAWLEYFVNGPNAHRFAKPIEETSRLIVPTICIYEVFKKILQQSNEGKALQTVASMQQGKIIELTSSLALRAAKISSELRMPMADSVILATARSCDAMLWTQDEDFKGLEKVTFHRKRKK